MNTKEDMLKNVATRQ